MQNTIGSQDVTSGSNKIKQNKQKDGSVIQGVTFKTLPDKASRNLN